MHGELVVVTSSGTFPTAKACLKHRRYRHFVACRVAAHCFAANTEGLFETYAGQISNEKSDVSGTDEVTNACKIVV